MKHQIDNRDYEFDLPNVPQLDRYLSKASTAIVSASIRLALDTCQADDRPELSRIFTEQPGQAVQVASAQLAARGFTQTASQQD